MIDRVRYTAFFTALSALWFYYWFAIQSPARWWLLWPALSCIVLAGAYGFNRPTWVCGKSPSGRIALLLLLTNLPWLVFTWVAWLLVVLFSREASVNPIAGTQVSISRYPLLGVDLSGFDRVFDLTAEFPLFYKPTKAQYHCLPNLDGTALHNFQPLCNVNAEEKILVHCAQGHGRSATFAAILLARIAGYATPLDAYQAIAAARPGAKMASSQRVQLSDMDRDKAGPV
jgi:hypothetical protein